MEKNLVLKLKGSIINSTVERLGYINGVFCSNEENVTSEMLMPKLVLKNPNNTITFRKLSGDITFYKGSSFENLTEIKEDTVELTSNTSDNSLYIKGTADIFYMRPSLGSRIEIGPSSNILCFGGSTNDWVGTSYFVANNKNKEPNLKLLVDSSNLLECEHLSKINIGVIVNITDVSDMTELKLDNFQGNIIIPESEIELNKLLNENSLKAQSLGNLYIVTINDKKIYKIKTDASLKINLTGNNFNTDIIQYIYNSKVSYSGTKNDYPFRKNKRNVRIIDFSGDNTNFDDFIIALAKYESIGNLNIRNVIITDASNSAIEQLKTKVTGGFNINGINKKK